MRDGFSHGSRRWIRTPFSSAGRQKHGPPSVTCGSPQWNKSRSSGSTPRSSTAALAGALRSLRGMVALRVRGEGGRELSVQHTALACVHPEVKREQHAAGNGQFRQRLPLRFLTQKSDNVVKGQRGILPARRSHTVRGSTQHTRQASARASQAYASRLSP